MPPAWSFLVASLALLLWLDVRAPSEGLEANLAYLEARAILTTQSTALPERVHDTGVHEGRVFQVHQPGQTLFILSHLAAAGERGLRAWKLELFVVFALSAVLLASALSRLGEMSAALAAPLAASVMFGAPYLPSLSRALDGSVHRTNHVFAILFIAAALFLLAGPRSSRQLWGVGICIGGAMVFRSQNVLLLSIPVCLLLQSPDGTTWTLRQKVRTNDARLRLVADLGRLMAGPIAAVVLISVFSIARLGSPFENGYLAIYEGRNDYLALRAREYGLWSLHFLPQNLWQTLFAFPTVSFDGVRIARISADAIGNSLLFSQPIFLLAFAGWKAIFNPKTQAFLVGALLLVIPAMLYHNPGFEAPGYMRYGLDYLLPAAAAVVVAARNRSITTSWIGLAWLLAAWAIYYGVALLRVTPNAVMP